MLLIEYPCKNRPFRPKNLADFTKRTRHEQWTREDVMKKNVKPAESRKKIAVSLASLERMMKTKLKETDKLLRKIKKEMPSLEELRKSTDGCEDEIFRFYHQSFKVYWIQEYTKKIVAKLQKL